MRILLLAILAMFLVGCEGEHVCKINMNTPAIIRSKTLNAPDGYSDVKYMYRVLHNYHKPFYSSIYIYTNENFKVGDTIKLTTK